MPNSLPSMSNKRPLTAEEQAMADRMKAIIANSDELTEESVAAAVGVTQGQVSHWTGARNPVSARRAPALAAALGIEDPSEISVAYREIAEHRPSDFVVTRQGQVIQVIDSKQSHAPRFDAKILAATHRALRELHEAAETGAPYNLESDPEHFLQAYELRAKLSQVSAADLVQIFKAAGLGMNHGVAEDGRSGDGRTGVPNEGTHTGAVARKVRRKEG
jgi:transcriptional regulator with XRE-family HTH domain